MAQSKLNLDSNHLFGTSHSHVPKPEYTFACACPTVPYLVAVKSDLRSKHYFLLLLLQKVQLQELCIAHFERWMHFARDLMLRRAIEISLVTTNKMMADFFTKPSDKTTFFRCRSYVMNLPDA